MIHRQQKATRRKNASLLHPFIMILTLFLFAACATTGVDPEEKKKADAARNLGEAYLSEGNYTAALSELLKAEHLAPEDPILHNNLGLVYMAKGKIDLAVEHFEKAVRLKPDYSVAKNNLGSAYLVREEWDKAIPILESVTNDLLYVTPQFPLANLGWAYYNKGEYEKARENLVEALELQPNFFIAQLNLGRTEMALNRLHRAQLLFEEAAEGNPKNPELLFEMGKTYRLLGDYDSAILALKGAIAYTDDSELAVKAYEELKKIYQ